jgi:DNA-binding NarL/FixJ family response regulator
MTAPSPDPGAMAGKGKLRLMLVDDHYLVRVGLASVIGLESDMEVVAEAATGDQAVEVFRSARPDVTLMDLRLPGIGGTEAIRSIRAAFPDARIIALSTFAGDEEIRMALAAGALAYLVKTVQPEELLDTIRKVAEGRRHVPPDLAARLALRSPRSHLSPRELEVVKLMVMGKRNREIALHLDITVGTVKIHVSNILVKLGAADRTEAVTQALQRGIVALVS